MDDIVAGVDRIEAPVRRVSGGVGPPNAAQGGPGADVVPTEVAGEHDDAVAAFEHTHVDGDRRDRPEEPEHVVGVGMKGARHFRREASDVVQEIAHAPHEDARVPEVAVAAHLLGARPVRFLHELRHPARTRLGVEDSPGWMYPKPGSGRVGANAHGYERVMLLGGLWPRA